MAKIEWSLICDYFILDVKRKASIVGIFENILSPHVPTVHPLFNIVTKLNGVLGEKIKFAVTILGPKGEFIKKVEIPIVEFTKINQVVFFEFKNTNLFNFGKHEILYYVNDMEVDKNEFSLDLYQEGNRM